ncbi:1-phosphofructokinase family hexose kinase [Chthonobacter albigriseus]|uniref:1-phosphofructokinase family hexose kinase n=1 Tax=Chthonobacter albigriseus TaxID=1683161 RepID=UPI0015EEBC64|nr:1-phosphofructokinase family hexose kinase [Chthonobacter albigriseus]
MQRIVTLTLNPAIDGASETDTVFPTHKIRTSNERYEPGGGGINVARVIRTLGGAATAVYLAGGATGIVLDELLDARGIERIRVPIADHTRVSHVVYERSTGREFRFVPEGPVIAEAEWKACLSAVEAIGWQYLVASGSLPRGVPDDFYVRLVRTAHSRGAKLVLDTSGMALKAAWAHGGLHLVKPSGGEFEALMGRKLPTVEAVMAAAAEAVAAGRTEILAVTLGHEGAVMATAAGVWSLKAPPAEAKSASGAGDSFVAAFVFALASGEPPEEAFRLAVATGTAAVLTPGTELCAKPDIDRLYAEVRRQPFGRPTTA